MRNMCSVMLAAISAVSQMTAVLIAHKLSTDGTRHICADFVEAGKTMRLFKLNTFCDTRFAAAEAGVYYNLCKDLPLLITKMQQQEDQHSSSQSEDNVTNREQLKSIRVRELLC